VKVFVPLASLSVPALAALIDQVLVRSLPVSVSVPAPPSIVPLMLPVTLSVKLSWPVPPVRLLKPLKSTLPTLSASFTLPALAALIDQVLVMLAPTSVSPLAPVSVSTLITLVPSVTVTFPVTPE
jgi:hypothetical protein